MSSRDITNIWQCPVVNNNYKKFVSLSEKLNELYPVIINAPESEIRAQFENMPKSINEEYFSIIESGNFYDKQFKILSEKYKLPNESLEECKSNLEMAAFFYYAVNSQIYLKALLRGLEKQITSLVSQASKLKYHTDKLLGVGSQIDSMFEGPSVYQLLQDTSENLEQLSGVRGKLRNSLIAKISNLGVKAPVGNPGLKSFILPMNVLWTGPMNRTLTQSYDGINGRKQFLEFLMDCLEPLDPTLPFDTVDNALKKQLADWKKV